MIRRIDSDAPAFGIAGGPDRLQTPAGRQLSLKRFAARLLTFQTENADIARQRELHLRHVQTAARLLKQPLLRLAVIIQGYRRPAAGLVLLRDEPLFSLQLGPV